MLSIFANGKTKAHRGEENLETIHSYDKQNTAALNIPERQKTKTNQQQQPKQPGWIIGPKLKARGPPLFLRGQEVGGTTFSGLVEGLVACTAILSPRLMHISGKGDGT